VIPIAIMTAALQAEPAALDSTCELHLYAMNLGAPPAVKGTLFVQPLAASGDPIAFINVINPYARMNDLTDDDYRTALNLPPTTRVIKHWDVHIDNGVRKTRAPLSPPRGSCNAELIGYYSTAFDYRRNPHHKDEVYIDFLYREYDPTGNITYKVDHGGYAEIAPARKNHPDLQTALADLKAGSKAILSDVSKAVAKQRAKSK
jgi:hypothetical protein